MSSIGTLLLAIRVVQNRRAGEKVALREVIVSTEIRVDTPRPGYLKVHEPQQCSRRG